MPKCIGLGNGAVDAWHQYILARLLNNVNVSDADGASNADMGSFPACSRHVALRKDLQRSI